MSITLLIIGILAAIVTIVGGYFAMYFSDRLHLILGYSAGAVMGVAMFDLIPEAIEMGGQYHDIANITTFIAIGFGFYLLIDRLLSSWGRGSHQHEAHELHDHNIGVGPIGLIIHSALDGLAIGLAYNIDNKVGLIIAAAVILHDFSDGVNTVSMSLLKSNIKARAKRWLYLDSIMPMLGLLFSTFIVVNEYFFSIVLALFAGFFLYIGASELIPESQHRHPHFWTTFTTLLGMITMYIAINVLM